MSHEWRPYRIIASGAPDFRMEDRILCLRCGARRVGPSGNRRWTSESTCDEVIAASVMLEVDGPAADFYLDVTKGRPGPPLEDFERSLKWGWVVR